MRSNRFNRASAPARAKSWGLAGEGDGGRAIHQAVRYVPYFVEAECARFLVVCFEPVDSRTGFAYLLAVAIVLLPGTSMTSISRRKERVEMTL